MNLKALEEKRTELLAKMENIAKLAEKEKRAFTEKEHEDFEKKESEVKNIDKTVEKEKTLRNLNLASKKEIGKEIENGEIIENENFKDFDEKEIKKRAKIEERALIDYIKSPEKRSNMTVGNNGAIIPTTIANKIIETIHDICPIYSMAEVFNVAGDLRIPYYGPNGAEDVICAYAPEFVDLTSSVGKFTSVTLTGFTAGSLIKISKSLINKARDWNFDLLGYMTRKLAEAVSRFLEHEFLLGTGINACQGILTGATNIVSTAAEGLIKADDLIDTQEAVFDRYQESSVWIMNRATRAGIRKLKDGQGNFLLNREFESKWGYTLLGKPVYTSENMPLAETDNKAVIYGDMTGFTVKMSQNIEIEVLNELYVPQHAVGVVGWCEIDSKVTDNQKISVLSVA
jgi:HK97 family phage major capsid protein